MAIKVIAQRREVKLGKNPGKKFVMRPDLYIPIAEKKVFAEASTHSGISAGVIKAAWDAAGEVIRTWATEGHSVPLPGLGTMRFGVRSKAVAELEDVKTNLISVRRIIFTPNVEVKDELKNTSIQITCLDEDGNVLKRVTSGDSGEVEDSENSGSENSGSQNSENSGNGENTENSGSGSGSNTNGSNDTNGGSENSGSQSQQNSVAAPTISGVNPFEETSQVSISGPDGATIYYSENGDDPDANDTLYTQPFTIDETTTIKAIAIKDGVSSQVTTKVFTKGTGGSGGFETGS
jgi:predicted histone-like DNA-binding protein